ncbi:MAG: DUF6088 family protein [Lachnospiraceae bacterium]|nr:DUF6088 family protein [Lachnospiraceae bacterium]
MSVTMEIKDRIKELMPGEIIMTSDFVDLSSITTVRKCLGRCTDDGILRRVFDGVYEKPKYSDLLKDYIPTDPEKVAYALARNYHWTIAPSGDIALNKLGLTTQVPAVWTYVSDGPYRVFAWGNIRIQFKHKANREISLLSKQTVMVVEAIRALGKERITAGVIAQLQKKLSDDDKAIILVEAAQCSEWIYETIRKVCTS